MLKRYVSMFREQVAYFSTANIDEIPSILKENENRIVYVDNVQGYSVVGNLWADRRRIYHVMGTDLLTKMLNAIDNPIDYDVVENDMKEQRVDLDSLPIPQYYPGEGGRYITSGVVFSEYRGKRNASFHRIMLVNKDMGVIRLVPRDLYRMHQEAMKNGESVNIAVAIGLPPHILLSAATSVDYEVDELKIASSLKKQISGQRESVVELSNGVYVPYESEIVLEGELTSQYMEEGPFVDITGTYDIVRKQPVVKFNKMYIRNRTLHLLVSGGLEHFNLMGMPREPTIYRAVLNEGVNAVDVRLTPGGCSWLHAVVKIKKRSEEDGRRAIYGAFKGHHSLKHVVVVDDDINIDNPYDVEFAIATRFQGDRDLVKMGPTRGSSLDPSAYEGHMTIKMGLDATMPLSERDKFVRVKTIK